MPDQRDILCRFMYLCPLNPMFYIMSFVSDFYDITCSLSVVFYMAYYIFAT